jgi:RND family efflux transporter MFP subunit
MQTDKHQPAGASGLGRRSTRVALLVVALAVMSAGYVVVGRARTNAAPAPDVGRAALTVTVAGVAQRSWPRIIEAGGPVAAWEEVSIGASIGGLRVQSLHVDVGDAVRRGQVLVQLDSESLRAEAQELSASLVQAQAQLAQADADAARSRDLLATGGVSEQDALQSRTQAQVARGQVAVMTARLAAKNIQLRQSQVLAPDDGVISARNVSAGAVAGTGQELLRLIRRQRLEWRGELTAAQVGEVGAGQQVVLALPDGTTAKAVVERVAPAMNAQTRLATLYARIAPGSRARAGMYASARIELAPTPARVVPAMSVVVRDGHAFVAKLADRQGALAVTLQRVTVGRRMGSEVEVVDGLADDDRIVVQGAGFLGDGDLVKVVGPFAPANGVRS